MHGDARDELIDVMRRFLRVTTTLVRAFPIHQHESLDPHLAVRSMLDTKDDSDVSWRDKFHEFLRFLLQSCTAYERT
ncbi:MAG: hypothetical protein JXB13_22700 [Phycisphaerae bacterium]|nr:hypothetical protein [Phycisphaerae bacterium]